MKNGLIKVTVLYPFSVGKTFNMDYYLNKHAVLVKKTLGEKLRGVSIEKGLGGMEPGSPPPFFVIASLYFESIESFQSAFLKAEILMADISNFTNTDPQIQISQVVIQEYPIVSSPSMAIM